MLRFGSILSKIVILHIIAVVITSLMMSFGLSWRLNVATDNIHNKAMKDQAVIVADHFKIDAAGAPQLILPPDLEGLYSQAYGRYSYSIVDDQKRAVFSSLSDHGALFRADSEASDIEFLQQRRGDATVSGASIKKEINGHAFWIQTGEDLTNRDVLTDDIVSDFYRNVGWITLPILLLLLIADIAIFRRALSPLRQASNIAASIGPTRTSLRLPTERIPSEVQPLVTAVNQALDRLERGFQSQRDFTADAAHELRTPLSILRGRAGQLENQSIGDLIRKDIDAMARVVGQLLDIAELDAITIDPQDEADLHAVCIEVAQYIAPLAVQRGGSIAVSGATEAVWISGNAEMLRRAMRNLAENAIKHCPKGTMIEFWIDATGAVCVNDDGPGIAIAERDQIFQRFWRRDRRLSGSNGLGLPIVKRIVELHGGEITVRNRVPGGTSFEMRFKKLN